MMRSFVDKWLAKDCGVVVNVSRLIHYTKKKWQLNKSSVDETITGEAFFSYWRVGIQSFLRLCKFLGNSGVVSLGERL